MVATITNNSRVILEKRYLEGESVESMWARVSDNHEPYRTLLEELRFLPNSPTLFNAGRNNGCSLSACFVLDVEDSMFGKGSITDVRNKAIAIAKAGGGVGYYFGNLRPRGSLIKSVHRKACGPVGVLKDYHAISRLITQGGKRELAQMGVLNCDHQDIYDFIHVKDEDPQGLGSFNISVRWTDEWIKDVFAKDIQQPTKQRKLWDEQCKSAWRTGCPGMLFFDAINTRANPNEHLGTINATNPCGETPNRGKLGEPCNLGSLCLPRYFVPGNRSINWNLLEEDIITATRFLDSILDRNIFPHPDITEAALLTRKLGLGVMGWADLLALMHIHYDTPTAVALGEQLMAFIEEVAHATSEALALEKGPYAGYCATKTQAPMRRNETSTSVAPTGTIAMIAGVWGSIEPHFAIDCERTTAEGIKLQDGMQEWIRDQLEGFTPKIASDIGWEWHIRHQAAFQKHTDLGVSKTINLPHSATVEDVSKCYKMLYDTGCKGGTIFRDGCRDEQVLVKDKTKSVYIMNQNNGVASNGNGNGTGNGKYPEQVTQTIAPTQVNRLPEEKILQQVAKAAYTAATTTTASSTSTASTPHRRKLGDCPSRRHRFKLNGHNVYLHVGLYEDGKPGEIFLTGDMWGSTVDGMLHVWSKTVSLALQYGVPLDSLVRLHKGNRFEPNGMTNNKNIPVCSSVPDYVVRWLEREFLSDPPLPSSTPIVPVAPPVTTDHEHTDGDSVDVVIKTASTMKSGIICPDCGTETLYVGGCLQCPAQGCGFSRCN